MRSKTYQPGAEAGEINADGNVVITLDGVEYYAHDLIWKMHHGVDPKTPLVHLDGDRTNNWIANLAETPQSLV